MTRFTRNILRPTFSASFLMASAMVSMLLLTSCSNSSNSSQAAATNPPTAESTSSPVTSSTAAPSSESDPIAVQVSSMSLEEKIGQMLLVGIDGTVLDDQAKG